MLYGNFHISCIIIWLSVYFSIQRQCQSRRPDSWVFQVGCYQPCNNQWAPSERAWHHSGMSFNAAVAVLRLTLFVPCLGRQLLLNACGNTVSKEVEKQQEKCLRLTGVNLLSIKCRRIPRPSGDPALSRRQLRLILGSIWHGMYFYLPRIVH